ncbi:MAG: alpha-2-macroglobulin family protein [Planctomycetota bacterium]|nr:alpha-2-macroglobulin family protein [Planctomycetota bacterium]
MAPRILPGILLALLTLFLAPLFPHQLKGSEASAGVSADANASDEDLEVPGLPISEELRDALFASSTEDALRLLDGLEKDQSGRIDDWSIFRADVLERAERYDEAAQVLEKLEMSFPESPWLHKARLRRSSILMKMERFGEAQKIIEEETTRLRGGDRIGELTLALLEVADRISADPDPTAADPKTPQYQRARQLYQQASQLQPPTMLLERALYGAVRCSVRISKTSRQVIEDADRYLARFDPRQDHEDVGEQLFLVLLDKARASGITSRRSLQDLIAVIEEALAAKEPWGDQFQGESGAPLQQVRADALLAIVDTYSSTDLRVSALRRFIEEAPDHKQRIRSGFRIGELLRDDGQSEAALSQWSSFIDEEIEGDEALLERLRRKAIFNSGQLLQQMKKFKEARDTFVEYSRRAPDGPDWSAAQESIIVIDAKTGEQLLADSRWAEGRTAIAEFAGLYPLDRRTRPLLLRSAHSHGAEARKLLEDDPENSKDEELRSRANELYEQTISDLKRIIGKYPDTREGNRARLDIAKILESDLLQLEEAVIAYKDCFGTPSESEARRRLQTLTEKHLHIETEQLHRSNQPASFALDTRNIEKVDVSIYPIDIEAYFRKYHSRNRIEQLDLDLIDPWKTMEVEVENYAKYRPCHQLVELPCEGSGTWAVTVASEKMSSTTLVVRTDIDIIVKAGQHEILVYAQDMLTGKSAEGVEVLIAIPDPDNQTAIQKVTTGSDGTAQYKATSQDSMANVKVLAMRGLDTAVTGMDLQHTTGHTGISPRGQFLTDRATYRPGETVFWRAVVRDVIDGSWHNPAGLDGRISLITPSGITVIEEIDVFSDAGTVNGSYSLPLEAPTGDWTIRVNSPRGITHQQIFIVEEFSPLTVDLKIEPRRLVYTRGEIVEATVSAMTWYGEPMAGSNVDVIFPDGRKEQFLLDDSGKVEISFDTREEFDNWINFQVYMPEHEIEQSVEVVLSETTWNLSIEIPRASGEYLVGESLPIVVKALDVAGEPVERDVKLRLVRRNRDSGRWIENTLTEQVLTTSSNGRAEVRIPLDSAGRASIVAEGTDRFGNRVSSRVALTISGDDEQRGLIWLVEKTSLDVGESIKLDLQNTRKKSPALLTIIGRKILEYRVVDLAAGKNSIDIAVNPQMYPEVSVDISMMENRKLHQTQTNFRVRKQLLLEVVAPEKPVTPGTDLTLEVFTRNLQGKPVSAEIALAVVDEAVDGLYPGWFQPLSSPPRSSGSRLSNSFSGHAILATSTSCTFEYQGITTQIAQELLDERTRESLGSVIVGMPGQTIRAEMEPQMRSLSLMEKSVEQNGIMGGAGGNAAGRFGFRPNTQRSRLGKFGGIDKDEESEEQQDQRTSESFTAHWEGALVSDENGRVEITFTVPQRSTSWKIRAQAIASDDLFGDAEASFIARDDIVIDPILPSSVMEGDVIEPRIRIVNSSDQRGTGTLSIRIGGGDGAQEISTDLVMGDGLQEVTLGTIGPLPVSRVLPVEVTLEIRNGDENRIIRQQRSIQVRPWGLSASDRAGGNLDTTAEKKLSLPGDGEWLNRKLQIWIGGSLDQILLDLAAGAGPISIRKQGHDTATRAAQLRGSLEVVSMVSRGDLEVDPQKLKMIRGRIVSLIGKLTLTQHDDGGWSWAGGVSAPEASASAMIALGHARLAGFSVPDVVFRRGVPSLERNFRGIEPNRDDQKAQILHALAICNAGDFGAANRLHRVRDTLSNASLSHLVSSLVAMKRSPMALEAAALLLSRRSTDGSWNGGPNAQLEGSWCRDPLIITAMCLHACATAGRPVSELATSAQWLESRRPWGQGRGAGMALAALARVQGDSIPSAQKYEVEIFIDGEPRRLLTSTSSNTSSSARFDLGTGPGSVEIRLIGKGSGKPHWAALLTGQSTEYPEITEDRFTINKMSYLRSKPRQDGRELPIGFSVTRNPDRTWQNHVKQLPLGSSTDVVLSVKNRDRDSRDRYHHEHLQIDITIPSGMSLLENSLSGLIDSHQVNGNSLRIWSRFRGDWNTFDVQYSLIGTIPGEYRVAPPVITSVSEPSRMSIGEAVSLTVLTRGRPTEDVYTATPDEIYNRGQLHWEEGRWREARELYTTLWDEYSDQLKPNILKTVARILLLSAIEAGDNSSMVSFFEVLKERDPNLNIDFDDVIRIGEAYRSLGEYSRSIQVFHAVMQETFGRDLKVTGVLQDQDPKASLQLLMRLVMEYPDLPTVLAAEQTLSDLALARAKFSASDRGGLSRKELADFGIDVLRRFLALHDDDPTAADAGLNLVSAFLDRANWKQAANVSKLLAQIYTEPRYVDSFRYTRAVALWSLGSQEDALKLLQEIADARYKNPAGGTRPSENRDLALYIIGQIHHASNQTDKAAEYYERVENLFEDARLSLARLRARELQLEEISEFRPGETVSLELKYRNVDQAEVLAYRVDLMTLALREKDLSRVTEVKLSGISPTVSTTVDLGKTGPGGGALPAVREVELPIEEVGAYLVLIRGGDVHTSGLVLINQMQLVVGDDGSRIRVQTVDPVEGSLIPEVEVRVIGSDGVSSGSTDRRGIFASTGQALTSTVIARRGSGDYAFHRGTAAGFWLEQRQQDFFDSTPASDGGVQLEIQDYFKNVQQFNSDNRMIRSGVWSQELKKERRGVQIKQASD